MGNDAALQTFLEHYRALELLAPVKVNQPPVGSKSVQQQLNRLRLICETINAQLQEQLHLSKHYAKSTWGLFTRMTAKLTAHSVAMMLNQVLGWPLLRLADGRLARLCARNSHKAYMKMYRFLAEVAAEYIPQQIGLLHKARNRKARKGVYAGHGPVPTGFIVDYNEKSKTYLKYVAYKPWGDRVFWLFERYFSLPGDFITFCRELDNLPYIFPDIPEEANFDPRNLPRKNRKKVAGGYLTSDMGLRSILTNPAYIGWWIVEGDVISTDNHEHIIPPEYEYLFWYAFERLSPFTIGGEVNLTRPEGPRAFFNGIVTNETGQAGDASHGNGGFETVGLADDEHRHVAAVAVTCHSQTLRVSHASCNALIDVTHDILVVPATPVALDFAHKRLPISSAAMRIAVKDGESLRRKELEDATHAYAKGPLRPTVNMDQQWITHSLTCSDRTISRP